MGEADPWHSRSQLYDQNNGSFSGNPFSVIASGGDTATNDNEEPTPTSISQEDPAEPYLDHHHFADVEQRFAQIIQFYNSMYKIMLFSIYALSEVVDNSTTTTMYYYYYY